MSLLNFTLSDNGLEALSYNGRTYIASALTSILGGAVFRTSGNVDTTYAGQLVSAATSRAHTASTVTHVYTLAPGLTITWTTTYTKPDRRTLKISHSVTHNDPSRSLARVGSQFDFTCPGAITFRSDGSVFPVRLGSASASGIPALMIRGDWGSVAMWIGDVGNNSKLYIESVTAAMHTLFQNFTQTPDNGDPVLVYEEDVIAPGESWTYDIYMRFSTRKSLPGITQVCPEAFKAARTAFPIQLSWEDRSPIGIFFSAHYESISGTNPRGYLWDSGLDTSDAAAFRAAAVAWFTDRMHFYMDTMAHRPVGALIWDIEGQAVGNGEYPGTPDKLPLLAPDMDLIADDIFRVFTDAGYLVGCTIRPGDVDPTPPNYTRTLPTSQAAAYTDLLAKARYAYNRWGCRIFYIDTPSVSAGRIVGPGVWRDLQLALPDCLFMPEATPVLGYANAIDYRDGRFEGMTPPTDINRHAFLGIAADVNTLSDSDKYAECVASVRADSIMLYAAFWGDPFQAVVDMVYTDAGK